VSEPVVVTCAVSGGEPSPNPHHPRRLEAIAREGIAAAKAGAAVLHLHAVDRAGRFSQEPEVYRELVAAIRAEAPEVLINLTTGASVGMGQEERLRSLAAEPELASLDCGSMNFGDDVFLNPPHFLRRAAEEMAGRGIKPELECFEAGHVEAAAALVAEGLVAAPPLVQLVLGVRGGAPARVDMLCHLQALLPQPCIWAATAVGRAHFPLMAATLALGGHVRTGLEDVARSAAGVWAGSNAELVRRAAALAEGVGRPLATPAEARRLLGLPAGAAIMPQTSTRERP
jgi:3-keto-5-aminohexanoate cleavage enzyme